MCIRDSETPAVKVRAEFAIANADGAPGWDILIRSQTGQTWSSQKTSPANGHLVAQETSEQRRQCNEEHNSCKGSCVRHGRRIGYRRRTNRLQRADVLLLRLQVPVSYTHLRAHETRHDL